MKFNIKTIPFWLSALIILTLAISTFIEKAYGTSFAYQHIYGAWWFSGLWGIVVIASLIGLYKSRSYKNPPLFIFHLSFVIILLGALCTKIGAQQGYIVLKQGVPVSSMQTDESISSLPFEVTLDTFMIQYYPGTDAPADYVSSVTIKDARSNTTVAGQISMNEILSYKGYRFYQSSYEPGGISILSINRDVAGIPVTYSGYLLFLLSFLWLMFSPKNKFRNLLRNPLLKKALLIILLFVPVITSANNMLDKDKLTASEEQAREFGNLWMLYDGRITTVSSFAHDFTIKLTGKPKFSHLNPEQVLMGFLFFPETWQHVAILKVEDKTLQEELNSTTQKASFADFFDETGQYKLQKYGNALNNPGTKKSSQLKEVEKLNEKIQLINMLHNGSFLKLFPIQESGQLKWYTPVDNMSLITDTEQPRFMRTSLSHYHQALHGENEADAIKLLAEIKDFQEKNAGHFLPSETHKKAEIFYLKHNFTSLLFKINLTLGILSLFTLFLLTGKKRKKVNVVFYSLLIACFIIHCISIGLRTYLAGRLPFSNGFETMLLIAWCAMFIAIIFYRKIPVILPFGFLVSGCVLLVAHLGMMNPKITPLVPVLSSPLLSIHVSSIMVSYTLFAFVALNSLISLITVSVSKKTKVDKTLLALQQNKIYSQICLYPALLFLGVGIFVGAVWANVSWGRYWGWDPKEVWALITFLVYSLVLHEKNIKFLSSVFAFHVAGLLAFATVLMTYFGVNYFLGGMHSYAGGDMNTESYIVVISIVLVLLFVLFAYYKYRKMERR